MIAIVIFYYKFWQSKKIAYLITFSIFTLILGFIHLFDVITLIPVFSFYMLWRLVKKKDNFSTILKYNLIYALIAIIPFIYIYYLFGVNPLFKEWNAQNILDTPKFLHVWFGYFFPLIFAISYLGYKIIYKKKDNKLMVNIQHEPESKDFNDNFIEILKLTLGSDPNCKLETYEVKIE